MACNKSMKRILFASCLLGFAIYAQEELDTSIFDGTGRELEKVDPQKPGAGSPETPVAPAETEAASASAAEPEAESASPPEPAMPEEIVLPGSEGAEVEELENPGEEPGIPAASGGSKSRAGETVESTEKIPTGQAVDFPWDM